MTSLSDTLTVGLVLVLLFGSIALYLYTRLQQAEQKISLLESILLDLKMSAEIKSYTELPASEAVIVQSDVSHSITSSTSYKPFEEVDSTMTAVPLSSVAEYAPLDDIVGTESKHSSRPTSPVHEDDIDDAQSTVISDYKTAVADGVKEVDVSSSKPAMNYEGMTTKELQTLAKSRGINSANSMKKVSLVEALKTSDRVSSSSEPGYTTVMTPFLESGPQHMDLNI